MYAYIQILETLVQRNPTKSKSHQMSHLKKVIEKWATFAQNIAEDRYGHSPDIRISGHVNSHFPYIEMPLDYNYQHPIS